MGLQANFSRLLRVYENNGGQREDVNGPIYLVFRLSAETLHCNVADSVKRPELVV